jgi:hypothetical protein
MARRYAETVQVQTAGTGGPAPSAFVWRGRRYVVRGVLGHWRERRAWWAGAAALALHGSGERGPVPVAAELDGEREVWRVEASSLRDGGLGVYDLARDASGLLDEPGPDLPGPDLPGPDLPAGTGTAWRLLRVTD